jgi:hypothetical protein
MVRNVNGQSVWQFENLRCSVMAITPLALFVSACWMAGILF